MIRRADFRALTFDCYGTLIDWESGLLAVLRPWARDAGLDVADRDLLAAFSRAEPRCQAERPEAPYPEILRDVHAAIARELGVAAEPAATEALARSVGDWPAFDDTPDALRALQRDHRLVVVSNVDRASFERSHARLGVRLDAVVTAEEVGAYKPDPRMFERAFEVVAALGVARSEILHVAESLFHDHVPAGALGLATVWVRRRRGGASRAPEVDVEPDLVVESLAELAASP